MHAETTAARESDSMDARSIADREPEIEHDGTVPVWYLVHTQG